MSGKGSRIRKSSDPKKYSDGWESIFGKKEEKRNLVSVMNFGKVTQYTYSNGESEIIVNKETSDWKKDIENTIKDNPIRGDKK